MAITINKTIDAPYGQRLRHISSISENDIHKTESKMKHIKCSGSPYEVNKKKVVKPRK
jgi:hypothetical protein